jgi:tRNA A37 threonylcarbamoyladenosine synthetase subunit TsaC/SUA5/YrdC
VGAASTVIDLAHGDARFLRLGALATDEVLSALDGMHGGFGRKSEV